MTKALTIDGVTIKKGERKTEKFSKKKPRISTLVVLVVKKTNFNIITKGKDFKILLILT